MADGTVASVLSLRVRHDGDRPIAPNDPFVRTALPPSVLEEYSFRIHRLLV